MIQIDEVGTVGERILQLVDNFHQGNKTAFGRAAGIQSGVLAGIVGGRESKPGFEILQKLLTAYPTVNPTWLLFGRGEMLLEVPEESVADVEPEPEPAVGPDGMVKIAGLSFLPTGYSQKHESERWNQYYRDRAQHKRMGSVVSSLVEYLAKRDDSAELRGILEMLPTALNAPLDPHEEDNLWDQGRDRLNDEYNAQQSAEWERQRQEREQQGAQQ